jgi:peptidylprolyl isomerase
VLQPEELDNLFRLHADHPNTTVAAAALDALRMRWADRRASADAPTTAAFYGAFSAGLVRRDLATTTSAATALADTLFRPLGVAPLLEGLYTALQAPDDVEPMVAILGALAVTGDTTAIPTLVQAASQGHPVVRQAAAEALERRLSDGIGVNTIGRTAPATPAIDWAYLQTLGERPRLVLETVRGRIVTELLTEQAPQTVQTVARLAEAGQYDGVPFHRVVPNFVAQGGDVQRGDGYGGPGYAIRSELTRIPYRAGVIGVASAGKDTEGSQFFFTHSAQPHLDGRYTAFGRIVEGYDVLDRLEEGDLIERVSIAPTPIPRSDG